MPTIKKAEATEEAILAMAMARYVLLDPEFRRQIEELTGPYRELKTNEERKRELLAQPRRIQKADDPLLYRALIRFTAPSQRAYDPEFAELYNQTFPQPDLMAEARLKLLALGHRVTLKEDRKLYKQMIRFCTTGCVMYDAEFAELYHRTYPPAANPTKKKAELLALGHRCGVDHPLWTALQNYRYEASTNFDPEFTRQYNETYPQPETPSSKKTKLLALGHRVTRGHPTLGNAFRAYTQPSHRSYDPEFTKLYNERYPK